MSKYDDIRAEDRVFTDKSALDPLADPDEYDAHARDALEQSPRRASEESSCISH